MKATQSSLPLTGQPVGVEVSDGAAVEHPARMAHAGLAWTLVRTDFKVRYHGTLSGFAWALLKPASMFLVLMGVFSFLFTDPAHKLQLIIGLFLWDFFAESTKVGMASLHAKAFLFKKMRVPLGVLVLSSIANPLITLGVFGVVIVVFLTAAGQPPSPQVSPFCRAVAALTLLVLGFSLATSVLLLRYRDLNQVWDVITQAGFFVAPIIYPLGIVPERSTSTSICGRRRRLSNFHAPCSYRMRCRAPQRISIWGSRSRSRLVSARPASVGPRAAEHV